MIFFNRQNIFKEFNTLKEFRERYGLSHSANYSLSKEFIELYGIPERFLIDKPRKKGALIFGDLDIEVEGAEERSSDLLDIASYRTILADEKDVKKISDFVRNYIRTDRTLFVFFGEGRNRRWKIVSV